MNETQRMMYECLVKIRNNEVNLRWTRNQLFFLMNSATLSLVATQLKLDDFTYGLACAGGLIFTGLWIATIVLIRRWIDYWDSMLRALESLNGQPITIFSGEIWQEKRGRHLTASQILVFVAVLFITTWAVMFLNWLLHNIS